MLGSIRDVDRTEKDQLLTLYNLRTDMRKREKRERLDKLYMKIDIRKSPMAKESAAKREKAETESVCGCKVSNPGPLSFHRQALFPYATTAAALRAKQIVPIDNSGRNSQS